MKNLGRNPPEGKNAAFKDSAKNLKKA